MPPSGVDEAGPLSKFKRTIGIVLWIAGVRLSQRLRVEIPSYLLFPVKELRGAVGSEAGKMFSHRIF